MQGLTGWEAAVPLAEETENPRRNVPRATMASIAIIGVMLVIVIWGQVIGWGVNNLNKLIASPELPALVIAHRVWGSLWWLALLAMFTSVIGASLACQNVATRMWYGMGRSGVAARRPSARCIPPEDADHRRHRAVRAVDGARPRARPVARPRRSSFILTLGFVLVIAVIFVYVVANLGVVCVLTGASGATEFNWFLHFIFPVGTSIVLIYSLYKSFNPFPAHPYN